MAPGDRLLNYANAAAYVLNILVTFVVGTTNKVGKTNQEISELYPTLFTPAGWAFSIWGLIFIMEGLFSVYQLLPSVGQTAAVQKGVGPWWILMVLLQVGWSFSFATEKINLSMAFMLGIFLALLALNLSLQRQLKRPSTLQYWLIQFPFSLNFGWITAATLANANIVAVFRDRGDLPAQIATAVCSCAVVGIAAVLGVISLHDPVYVAVLVWAGTAVSKQLQSPVDEISGKFPAFLTDGIAQAGFVLVAFAALCVLAAGVARIQARNAAAAAGEGSGDDAPSPVRGTTETLLKP